MSVLEPPVRLPRFTVTTLDGDELTSTALEVGLVQLSFHRYAACPVCSARLAEYRVHHGQLAPARVVWFFHSPVDKIRRYLPNGAPFTIAADPDFEVYRQFGITRGVGVVASPGAMLAAIAATTRGYGVGLDVDGTAIMRPADFLVRDGVVVRAHYGRHMGDSWSVSAARAAIAECADVAPAR